MPITRRELLGALSASTFFLTVPNITAAQAARLPEEAAALDFPQGVASGDPRPDAIMLWTRAIPTGMAREINTQQAEGQQQESVKLILQVSESEDFSSIALESLLSTSSISDYTVRVNVSGLQPDRHYYYRFLGGAGTASRTGRTRTAPTPDQARDVTLAFASCQSFEQGYYGSWARMIADDREAAPQEQIQFVLHLGDFIYERSWNRRYDGTAQSRYVPPFPDGVRTDVNRHAVSLADYRHLYHTYLADPWLQEARARWPFICVWDDHEFSNDNHQSYSTYDGESKLEPERRQIANQAWFEFIPAALDDATDQPAHDFRPVNLANANNPNVAARNTLCIYRKLRWGQYLDLVLTDNRSYRSAPCIAEGLADELGLPINTVELVKIADAGKTYNQGQPPEFLPYGDGTVKNVARDRDPGTCLGNEQRKWFLDALENSSAPWKLWGNSIPLMPLRLDLSSIPLAGYEDGIYTIDPWAGFPQELSLIMDHLAARDVTGLVSLSGDHHLHGAATINRAAEDPGARAVAVDFSVAGISSSPTYEDAKWVAEQSDSSFSELVASEIDGQEIPLWNMTLSHGVLASFAYGKTGLAPLAEMLGPNDANPGLKFVDTLANGYGLAKFTGDLLEISLVAMNDLSRPFERAPEARYRARFSLPLWAADETPAISGPRFEGTPPFPFTPTKV